MGKKQKEQNNVKRQQSMIANCMKKLRGHFIHKLKKHKEDFKIYFNNENEETRKSGWTISEINENLKLEPFKTKWIEFLEQYPTKNRDKNIIQKFLLLAKEGDYTGLYNFNQNRIIYSNFFKNNKLDLCNKILLKLPTKTKTIPISNYSSFNSNKVIIIIKKDFTKAANLNQENPNQQFQYLQQQQDFTKAANQNQDSPNKQFQQLQQQQSNNDYKKDFTQTANQNDFSFNKQFQQPQQQQYFTKAANLNQENPNQQFQQLQQQQDFTKAANLNQSNPNQQLQQLQQQQDYFKSTDQNEEYLSHKFVQIQNLQKPQELMIPIDKNNNLSTKSKAMELFPIIYDLIDSNLFYCKLCEQTINLYDYQLVTGIENCLWDHVLERMHVLKLIENYQPSKQISVFSKMAFYNKKAKEFTEEIEGNFLDDEYQQ